ncbi:hypothetical protein CASFOL_026872 [Castilleja foliolosa]|uniref:Transposase-associated domain-containing protein n=1 Tax=Castilleja foliolosa TaxID=1961234 RepID=A0ABD3CLL8_9LAMI
MNITDRSWMYKRRVDGFLSNAFVDGVESFIQFALTRPSTERDGDKMKCPCRRTKCCNRAYRSIDEIKFHLCSKGFVPDYLIWSHHGETNLVLSQCNVEVGGSSSDIRENSPNNYVNTVQDAAELEFEVTDDSEAPTAHKLQLTPHQRPDETVTKPILTDLQARQSQSQESRTPDDVYPTLVRHKKGRRFSTGALIKEYNCGAGSSSEIAEVRRLKRELREAEMRHQEEVYTLMSESLEAKKRHLEEVYTLREEMEEARQREWLKILGQIQQQADAAVSAAMARQAGQANPPPPPPPSTDQ